MDQLVFREEGRSRSNIVHTYEHNERTLERYFNKNIKQALTPNNHYFKSPTGTYEEMLDKMLEAGIINTKGLKSDANVFSEVLIAVNRDYFKTKEEAVAFFKVAYGYICEKAGEDMVLSAVVHCDEETDGRINYHMHVVFIPTVEKRRFYTKRSQQYRDLVAEVGEVANDDERLLKAVERQVSHSKFYDSYKQDGAMVYGYSVWQDELTKLLKEAGYAVERGSVGNHALHLHPNQYKQLVWRIDTEAKRIKGTIRAEPAGDKVLVDVASFNALNELQLQVTKEKVALDMGVVALQEQQKRLHEYQHNAYLATDKSLVELQQECSVLQQKCKVLKQALVTLRTYVAMFYEALRNILEVAITGKIESNALAEYIKSVLLNQKIQENYSERRS